MTEFGLPAVRQLVTEMEDGITYRFRVKVKVKEEFFHSYRLKKSVYEAAAREAGFDHPVQWIPLQEPDLVTRADDVTSLPPEVRKQVACPDFGLILLQK